jgi:hypothetical protein
VDYARYLPLLSAINSAAFSQAVADGRGGTDGGFLAVEIAAGLLTAALTYLGVRPRLREYR